MGSEGSQVRKSLLFLLFLIPLSASAQYYPIDGYCTKGTTFPNVAAIPSITSTQGIAPSCQIDVYLSGTTNHATIYSNSSGTALGNPFTAGTNGYWIFYVAGSQTYDVVGSGGTAPNAYSTPTTIRTAASPSTAGVGCLVSANPYAILFAPSPAAGCTNDATITINPTSHTITSPYLLSSVNSTLNAYQFQSTPTSNDGIALSVTDCLTYSYACQILAPALYAQTEEVPFGGFGYPFSSPTGGPKSSDPRGCVIDNRYAVPELTCNQGLPISSDNRYSMAPWGITENALSVGTYNTPQQDAARISLSQYMGARDFQGDETYLNALVVNGFQSSPAINNGVQVNQTSLSPSDTIPFEGNSYGVGSAAAQNEGDYGARLYGGETYNISQVTLSGAPTCGVTCTMSGTQTEGNVGAFGEELPWIDLTNSYSTGYIASLGFGTTVTGSSSTNWDSVYGDSNAHTTLTAALPDAQPNPFPMSNATLTVASTSGFTTGPACEFDSTDVKWQCFHITSVTDSTHLVIDKAYYPMFSGSTVAQGGLTGYGFEMDADDVCGSNGNGISTSGGEGGIAAGICVKAVVPIVYNSSGNVLTVYNGPNTSYYGGEGPTRGYQQMSGSGATVSITVSGGVVTACTVTSGGSGYPVGSTNVPQIVISGITYTTAPLVYVSYSTGAISSCAVANGGSGISGTPTATVVPSNPYHIYSQAESVQNYNATTGNLDASALITMPWAGAVNSGDVVEQEHYFRFKQSGMLNLDSVAWQLGGFKYGGVINATLNGVWGNNDYAISVTNNTSPSVYLGNPSSAPYIVGQGQMTTPYGIVLQGPFAQGLLMRTPPFSGQPGSGAVSVLCAFGSTNWCASNPYSYTFLSGQNNNNSRQGYDVLNYSPATQIWTRTEGATGNSGAGATCTQSYSPASATSPGTYDSCGESAPIGNFGILPSAVTNGGLTSGVAANYNLSYLTLTGLSGGGPGPWIINSGSAPTIVTGQTNHDGTNTASEIEVSGALTISDSTQYQSGATPLPASTPITMGVWLRGNAGGETVTLYVAAGNGGNKTVTLTTAWSFYCVGTTGDTALLQDTAVMHFPSTENVFFGGVSTQPGTQCGPVVPTTTTTQQITPIIVNSVPSLSVGGSQVLNGVQGSTGTKFAAATGSFTNGNLRATDSSGNEIDAGIAAANVSRYCGVSTFAASTSGSAVSCAWVTSSSHCSATWQGTPGAGILGVTTSSGSVTPAASASSTGTAAIFCSVN